MTTTNAFIQLQSLITNANFTPVPSLPTTIYPAIPAIPKRTQKTFINPLTLKVNDNTYKNRYRVNKEIEARNIINTRNIETINRANQANLAIGNRTQIVLAREFSNHGKIRVRNDYNQSTEDFFNWIRMIKTNIPDDNAWRLKNITLYWTRAGREINRTLRIARFMRTFEDFATRFNQIKRGEGTNPGSDASQHIEDAEWIFNPKYADLWFVKPVVANASAIRTIFNIHGVNLKAKEKKDCINKSMEIIGYPNMKLNTLDNLLAYIKTNNLPIKVISNILNKLSPKPGKTPQFINHEKYDLLDLFKINTDCKYEINELYKPDNGVFNHTLLYCPLDKHVDVIKDNNIQMLDDVYATSCNEIFKIIDNEYKMIYTVNDSYKNAPETKNKMRQLYVCFDYETIIDWECDNIMKPYSLSWFWFDHEQMEGHLEDNEALTKYYRDTSNRQSHIGFDCSEKFLKWILDNENNTIMRFIGFNSANFDNFLLFTAIMEHSVNVSRDDFTIADLLYNGNQLLSFKLNGRHTPYDIKKHLVGSLANNCDAFKVPQEFSKISGFSHDSIQQLYNDDKANFINNIKDNEEITKYNDNDVLSLGYLFIKYYKAMTNIDPVKFKFLNGEEFVKYGTIGGIIMKIAEQHWEAEGIKLPKLDINQYRDVLRGKTAGRVDLFQHSTPKILEEIVSFDVCSLYPYIMAVFPGFFPCGEIKPTEEYISSPSIVPVNKYFAFGEWRDGIPSISLDEYALRYGEHTVKREEIIGKIAFYYCDVDQRSLKQHNLPNILPKKIYKMKTDESGNQVETGDCLENKWDSDEIINNVLISNITIDLLKKYESFGVTVNIKKGFYFTGLVKSIKMFEFLMPLMAMKNKQDTLKKEKSAEYNPVMRDVTKLLMNSISGKIIESLHTQQVKMITTAEDYIKIDAKYNVNTINSVGNAVFVSYDKTEEELINKQRPVYIGALIYEYARRYMYETIMHPIGLDKLLYMDTDACKFRASDINTWQITHGNKNVPHWPEVEKYDSRYINHKVYDSESKVFGSFENELDENNISYFLQKKTWLTAHVKDGKVSYIKCRFKGINPGSFLLDGSEPFLLNLPFSGKEPEIISDDIDIFKWCMENKHMRIGGDYDGKKGDLLNQLELYEQIYTKKYAYILCNNIQRVVKNTRRGVSIEDTDKFNRSNNCVRAQYMIKKIQLN